jgi:hypothetical protein
VNITNNGKRGGHDEDKYDIFGVKNSFALSLRGGSYFTNPFPSLLGGLCRKFFNSVGGFAVLRSTATGALLGGRSIRILPMNQHA